MDLLQTYMVFDISYHIMPHPQLACIMVITNESVRQLHQIIDFQQMIGVAVVWVMYLLSKDNILGMAVIAAGLNIINE